MVRIPKNSPEYISYVLDAGAYGVIVPMVNHMPRQKPPVRSCRYAPRGAEHCGGTGQRCPNRWRSI